MFYRISSRSMCVQRKRAHGDGNFQSSQFLVQMVVIMLFLFYVGNMILLNCIIVSYVQLLYLQHGRCYSGACGVKEADSLPHGAGRH